jgi:hypothetical protein
MGFRAEGADAEARRKELERKAARYKPALELLMRTFEERFRKPLELPEFESDKGLYVWIFDSLPAYQEYVRQRRGLGPGSDVNAFFSPKVRWVYAGLSDDATVARYLGRDLTHTAVHQLQWYYSKEKWDNYFEEWNGLWFTLGFAAYLGGGIDAATEGRPEFTGADSRRVEILQLMKDNGIPFAPLRELVQIESVEGFGRWWRDTWNPRLSADEELSDMAREVMRSTPGFAMKMLYAQSWYLAYFLNEYEGGKYRQKYLDLLMTALRGKRKLPKYGGSGKRDRWKSSFDAFAGIMGLAKTEDWKRLQREHDGFVSKALSR